MSDHPPDWSERIPRCFSPEGLVFASTPTERAVANRLRAELRNASVPSHLLESAIEDWLHQECSNTGHIFEQMARVRSFFG